MTEVKKEVIKTPVMNRSYVYILPMIILSHNLRLEHLTGFLGVFLFHKDHPEDDRIYLHFKYLKQNARFIEVHSIFELSNQLVSIDYPAKDEILYTFKVPAEYRLEYEKFMKSKYSEFSENYKQCILKFHKLDEKNGKDVKDVLYKRERAYLLKEEAINEGLPPYQWTRNPRDQEIGYLLSEIKEQETFKP